LERGIKADIIIGRCETPLSERIKEKISLFCNVPIDAVVSGHNVENVYEIPEMYYRQGILSHVALKLGLNIPPLDLKWPRLTQNLKNLEGELNVAICGKYAALEDSYASVVESLKHCSAHLKKKINIEIVDTENLIDQEKVKEKLKHIDAIIVPGGFGNRGIEGKIEVIRYARENKIPFLGICLGLQLSIIEFLRDIIKLEDVNSEELDPNCKNKAIVYLPGQHKDINMGGTMRLGGYEAVLVNGSKISKTYNGEISASERHRHRYEVNPAFHEILKESGMNLCGMSPDGKLVEFISLDEHPYFVATQAHPELKSKLENPAPLFLGLTKAAVEKKNSL
jgi:CTP synthase